jgi:hypothetical protein
MKSAGLAEFDKLTVPLTFGWRYGAHFYSSLWAIVASI